MHALCLEVPVAKHVIGDYDRGGDGHLHNNSFFQAKGHVFINVV
jgi:hypothetical protein